VYKVSQVLSTLPDFQTGLAEINCFEGMRPLSFDVFVSCQMTHPAADGTTPMQSELRVDQRVA
jgi:hypothetical protein